MPLRDVSLRQSIAAPTDGVVVDLKIHTIGATVAPREPLMDIVPDNQRLIVEAKLPQEAISELHTGMPADVYIQTLPRSAIQYLLDPVTDSLNKAFRER